MTLFRISNSLKDVELNQDLQALFDNINSSEYIGFEVLTAGTEVAIPHGLEHIPRYYTAVDNEVNTGSGANVYGGSTAWTKRNIYLTATLAGTYTIILRR